MCLPFVIPPVLEVALVWPFRECQCNDGIITIVVHIIEEPLLSFWTEMETTYEEADKVVADGIRTKFSLSRCW